MSKQTPTEMAYTELLRRVNVKHYIGPNRAALLHKAIFGKEEEEVKKPSAPVYEEEPASKTAVHVAKKAEAKPKAAVVKKAAVIKKEK